MLTPEQEALKQKIDAANSENIAARNKLYDLIASCKHVFKELTPKQMADRWLSISAVCLVCGAGFGWRCKVSPTGHCEYTDGEECAHCGMPDERK